jgi:hypothetical protein
MRRTGLAALMLATVCLAAAPACARRVQGFCTDLKAVTADAANGFDLLRGANLGLAWDDGDGDDETHYAATHKLPGALDCGVDRDQADGDDLPDSYVCWFAAAPSKVAAVRQVAARITDCIGGDASDRLLLNRGDTAATFDLNRSGYVISVTAGAAAPTVILEISGK